MNIGIIKETIAAINGFIDRVQKMPLIIISFGIASHDIWRTLESDKKEERKDAMVKAAQDRKDYVTDLYIAETKKVAVYQDSSLARAQRDYQRLLDNLKK